MKVVIWGSRGSTPINGSQFAKYSGETACIEVKLNTGQTIFLDAGTGLRTYAAAKKHELKEKSPVICLSHMHFDHVQGLPFYSPIFNTRVEIYGPQFSQTASFDENLSKLFDGVLFPIKRSDLKKLQTYGIFPNSCLKIGTALIETIPANHPGGNLAWKIQADGQTLVYTGDHEIPLDKADSQQNLLHEKLLEFMENADLAIADSHFSEEDHLKCKGWGHSDFNQWTAALAGKNIKALVFTHFSPDYNDQEIDRLFNAAFRKMGGIKAYAAYPGLQIDLQKL